MSSHARADLGRLTRSVAVATMLAVLAGSWTPAAAQAAGAAPPAAVQPAGGAPAPPPPVTEERKVLRQFDANGNARLDTAERKAARAWLADQPPVGLMAQFSQRPGGITAMRAGRGYAPTSPGPRVTPADVRSGGKAPLYDAGTLRTIFLEFENADWEKELEAFNNTDVDVPATMRVDGEVYRDVGVHFRGASSFLFVPEGSKRSLNIAVDFANEDQRLLGYRTLNLLNVNSDPTFTRALLYTEISRHYLPTPKANYVRVVINGESWGVYVNTQQYNADFLREHFPSTRGARWKVPGSPRGQGGMNYIGEDLERYKKIYEIKTRDDAKSWAALKNFFKVLTETPLESLEAALTPIFNIDGALRFLALEMALVNSDGYWTRASDYNIYLDEQGKVHIIPHDVNEGLDEQGAPPGPGRGGPPPAGNAAASAGQPGAAPPQAAPPQGGAAPPPLPAAGRARADLDPLFGLDDASKPLRSRLLAVPALRAKYLAYVREIAEKWLDWKTLEPLARQYQSLIAEEVKADTRKLYSFERFQADVADSPNSLKSFADKRRAFLLKTP